MPCGEVSVVEGLKRTEDDIDFAASNYTLHPAAVVGLGADFVRILARRG